MKAFMNPFLVYALVCLLLITRMKYQEQLRQKFYGIEEEEGGSPAESSRKSFWDQIIRGNNH
jgi:hypothetical protein